jgi:CheY-like chemotaxis protein
MARSAIMVVDADAATARRIKHALRGADLDVHVVPNLQQAMGGFGEPRLVAIFSAVSLPGGNGYELARRATELRPGLPVFLLWGGFEPFDEDRAMVAGVRAGIRRPISPNAVLAHLEDVIGPVPVHAAELVNVDPIEELLPVGSIEPLEITGPAASPAAPVHPPVADERLATFVPADYESLPPVHIDREEVSVALERAVLAVLPEVLEAILHKSLDNPTRLRALLRQAVEQSVQDQLPVVVDRALRERLGEDDQSK